MANNYDNCTEAIGKPSAQTAGGILGGGYALKECEEPCRQPLRDAIQYQLRDAVRQSRKAAQLDELAMLLDKNPDVARILELMEVVRR